MKGSDIIANIMAGFSIFVTLPIIFLTFGILLLPYLSAGQCTTCHA